MTKPLKAILFDFDGTLRDTKHAIMQGYEHIFAANDLPIPTSEALAPHIHHHSFVHKALAPHLTVEEFETPYHRKLDELWPSVTLFDGAKELLQTLSKDYQLGLVTAARHPEHDLQRFNIEQYFSVITSGRHITKHKPDPEGMLYSLKQLGVSADETIYIGDMVTDIYAAQAAGLRACIGVTIGFANRRELEQAGADYVVDSLAELPNLISKV